ncbi:uncharacterized protein K460DRAFT_334887 [Cucurbitaria berberidis CBS 394.84]|uniref:Uncharacterized protein n=1 Tax=Cucurbitaria berberidis CBS 394.84 TaxID=1168544 RepID=A0A9P4GMX8_9PLEO|nr:uncharacterized protein K460DRAFT_334887 [Cucurbitaria berberidis CBS 394.84]KAF1848597.1 hypothetical protein K460DRAFT_334887 [Cucurbitaria berberidis CBS 394.84]
MKRMYTDGLSALQVTRSHFASFWLEGHLQARNDWRARWKRGALWLFASIWITTLLTLLSMWARSSGNRKIWSGSACQPDGSFAPDLSTYRYWTKWSFFQVTIGFGNLTFAQAKAVDIIWDVFFGRGGQALLAFISWRVFANYVTTSMEVTPVTFGTYRTVFLQNESLLVATPRIVRDFTRRHGLHSKTAMVFIVMTMAFILVFPTFGSAMTGYSGNVKAYVAATDTQLIAFEDFRFALYTIHDGWRIGKGGNYVVISPTIHSDPILTDDDENTHNYCRDNLLRIEDCYVMGNVTSYVQTHDFFGIKNEPSVFMDIKIPPPTLNISALYIPYSPKDRDRYESRFGQKLRMTWTYSNKTYPLDFVREHGSCQALLDYKWGFSFIQLFFMTVFLIVWSLGIYIIWLRSHIIMKKRGLQDVAGEFKAVFELADAMRSRLEEYGKEEGVDLSTLPEFKLRHRITKDLRGGAISYETSLLSTGEDGKGDSGWGFKLWVKREKWWLTTFLVFFGAIMAGIYLRRGGGAIKPVFAFVHLWHPLEITIAMYIGSTHKSRGVILLWSFVVLTIVPLVIVSIHSAVLMQKHKN